MMNMSLTSCNWCGYMVCSYLGNEESEKSVPEYTYFLKKVSVSSVKSNAVGKIKVKWRTDSYASGYQIRLSTTKSFTENTTDVITIKGRAKASKTISKLKGGKKYYVQVRAYRTYHGDGYYSEWSATKSVKVKVRKELVNCSLSIGSIPASRKLFPGVKNDAISCLFYASRMSALESILSKKAWGQDWMHLCIGGSVFIIATVAQFYIPNKELYDYQ